MGTLHDPTATELRDAFTLLAGCHPWRHRRPDHALLTHTDWQRLLPLVVQVQRQRPDLPLTTMLTDRVRSARSLPAVLAWRLWELLRRPLSQNIRPQQPPAQPKPHPHSTIEDTNDWHQHRTAVHQLGGPVAVRAALHTTGSGPARSPAKGCRLSQRGRRAP